MMSYLLDAGSLAKRAVQNGEVTIDYPWWGFVLILLNFALLLPGMIFTAYTLGSVFPTLAVVEDPNPSPAYAPLSLANQDEERAAAQPAAVPLDPSIRKPDDRDAPASAAGPVTGSIRKTARLLGSHGGWRSYFRGILCAWAISVCTGVIAAFFVGVPVVGLSIGTLVANLALVQLNTAWVHIVISSQPLSAAFWRRLPPFRRAFDATALPVLAVWAANSVGRLAPRLVAWLVDLPVWDPSEPTKVPEFRSDVDGWKSLVVALVGIVVAVFLVIPANVALIRVQASLLPVEQDAIVAFDRSFGGLVEPAIVGGKGYATIRDALTTFSRASWVRLYKLYAKVFAISIAFMFLAFAIMIPTGFLIGVQGVQHPAA